MIATRSVAPPVRDKLTAVQYPPEPAFLYGQALSIPPSPNEGHQDGPKVPRFPAQVGPTVIGCIRFVGRDHAKAALIKSQGMHYNLYHPHLVPPTEPYRGTCQLYRLPS